MPLFLFLLAKAALASMPTAHFVTQRLLFPFGQAKFVQVFALKHAPLCKLSAGHGSTGKSATPLFLLSLCLLRLSFHLKLSGRSGANYLFFLPILSGYNGSPDNHLSLETTRLMELARKGSLLPPSAILCSLSPLTSII